MEMVGPGSKFALSGLAPFNRDHLHIPTHRRIDLGDCHGYFLHDEQFPQDPVEDPFGHCFQQFGTDCHLLAHNAVQVNVVNGICQFIGLGRKAEVAIYFQVYPVVTSYFTLFVKAAVVGENLDVLDLYCSQSFFCEGTKSFSGVISALVKSII